jgi:hypothetical protein
MLDNIFGFLVNLNPLITTIGALMALILSFVTIKKIRLEIVEKKRGLIQSDYPMAEPQDKAIKTTSVKIKERSVRSEYLPGDPIFFLGRNIEINNVIRVLLNKDKAFVVAISGLGGIGKTALALEITHQNGVKKHFPHIIWESSKQEELIGGSIHNTGPHSLTLNSLLDHIAKYFGNDEIIKIKDIEKKKLEVQKLLQDNPTLIILDNMETCRDFSKIILRLKYLCGKASKAILTSRRRMDDFDFVYSVHLAGLEREQSFEFLMKEIEIRNITTMKNVEETILDDIWKVTGGAPLAMKLVVGQSARRPVTNVLENLKKAKGDIYAFIYLESWKIISTEAQKILISFSPFINRVSTNALLEVSALSEEAFTKALDELLLMSLVEVNQGTDKDSRDYHIHSLTRNFILSDLPEIWKSQRK